VVLIHFPGWRILTSSEIWARNLLVIKGMESGDKAAGFRVEQRFQGLFSLVDQSLVYVDTVTCPVL